MPPVRGTRRTAWFAQRIPATTTWRGAIVEAWTKRHGVCLLRELQEKKL